MRNESVVKAEGMKILRNELGSVDAERFVYLMIRESFDYTEWRSSLQNEDISLRDLSRRAMDDVRENSNEH